MNDLPFKFDEIGIWSELKLEIVEQLRIVPAPDRTRLRGALDKADKPLGGKAGANEALGRAIGGVTGAVLAFAVVALLGITSPAECVVAGFTVTMCTIRAARSFL